MKSTKNIPGVVPARKMDSNELRAVSWFAAFIFQREHKMRFVKEKWLSEKGMVHSNA